MGLLATFNDVRVARDPPEARPTVVTFRMV